MRILFINDSAHGALFHQSAVVLYYEPRVEIWQSENSATRQAREVIAFLREFHASRRRRLTAFNRTNGNAFAEIDEGKQELHQFGLIEDGNGRDGWNLRLLKLE